MLGRTRSRPAIARRSLIHVRPSDSGSTLVYATVGMNAQQQPIIAQVAPGGRTARLERKSGKLVAVSDTVVTDDDVFAVIDAGRR